MTRFGVFADAHYARGKQYGNRFCDRSLGKLERCLKEFREREVESIVNLGDLIDGAHDGPTDLANYAAMRELLDGSGRPVHHVLGNHDLESMDKARALEALGATGPRTWYGFGDGSTRLIVLDACFRSDGAAYADGEYDWTDTFVPDDELTWLAEELSGSLDPAVVFVHQNLDHRLWQGKLDPHLVRNADAVRRVLESARCPVVVLQGHYHPGLLQQINGVTYLTLGAMCEGGTAEDNAYAVVTVDGEAVTVEGFARQESYRLELPVSGGH